MSTLAEQARARYEQLAGKHGDTVATKLQGSSSKAGRDFSAELFGPTEQAPAASTGRDFSAELFGGETKPSAGPQFKNEDDLIRHLGGDPALIKKSRDYKPGMFMDALIYNPNAKQFPGSKAIVSTAAGLAKGLMAPVRGASNIVTDIRKRTGTISPEDAAVNEMRNKVAEYDYQNITGGAPSGAAEFAGEVLSPLPGTKGIGKATTTAARLGRSALVGGEAGAVFTAAKEDLNEEFMSNVGLNALIGTVLGPVAEESMGKVLIPGIVKAVNASKGNIDAVAKNVIALAKQHGIDLTYGDIKKGSLASRLEAVMEGVPLVGLSKYRNKQQAQVSDAAHRVAETLNDAMISTPYKGLPEVQKAADAGDKVAQDLLEAIQNAGEDWGQIVQTSGGLKAFRAQLIADKLYDRVNQEAVNAGHVNVPLKETLRALDEAISDLSGSKMPFNRELAFLKDIRERLEPPVPGSISKAVGAVSEKAALTKELQSLTARKPGNIISDIMDEAVGGRPMADAPTPAPGAPVVEQIPGSTPSETGLFSAGHPMTVPVQQTPTNVPGTMAEMTGKPGGLNQLAAQLSRQELAAVEPYLRELTDGNPEGVARQLRRFLSDNWKNLGEDNPLIQAVAKVADREQVKAEQLKSVMVTNPAKTLYRKLNPDGEITNTFGSLRALDSDLGSTIAEAYRAGDELTGNKLARVLSKVQSALNNDMGRFAESSPSAKIKAAWQKADRFYETAVVPFKDRALSAAYGGKVDSDKIYTKFIQKGAGVKAEKFYQSLDQKGQAAVRYGMVQDALDKSFDESIGVFSPRKFATELEKLKTPKQVFFKGQSLWELRGFVKLMRHVENAETIGGKANVSQKFTPYWLVGGVVNPKYAAAMLTASALAKMLFTTNAGKSYLLAASRMKTGSPAMQKLLMTVASKVPQAAGAATSNAGATNYVPQ